MASLQQIFGWFSRGLFPTQDQYKQTWSSFWHKSEKLPLTQLQGLSDNEDLSIKEESNTQILKFANRKYNKANFSGKGFNILRKNLANGLNILSSDMLSESDTIYNIRYDYNLNGQTIEIPQGCILNFDGGSISNGILVFNHTFIKADLYQIFNNVTFKGYIKNGTTYPEWFGAKGDGVTDCYFSIQNTIDSMSGGCLKLQTGTYLVSNTIILRRGIIIKGKGNDDTKKKGTIIKLADNANSTMLELAKDAEHYNGLELITFDGNASNQSQPVIGVKFHGFITSYIKNIMIKNVRGTALSFDGPCDLLVEHLWILYCQCYDEGYEYAVTVSPQNASGTMTAMLLMNRIYIENTLNKPSGNPRLNENDRGKGISLSGVISLNVNDIHFEGVSDAITFTGTNSHFVEIYGFHASHIGITDSDTAAIKMADTYCHNIIFSGGRAYNCKWSNVLKNNTNLTNIPSIPYEYVILRGFNIKSDVNYKGVTHSFIRSILSMDILSTNTSNGSLNVGTVDGNNTLHYTLNRNGVNFHIQRNGEIFLTVYDSGNEGRFVKIHHPITLPSRNTVSNISAGNILAISGKPVYTLGGNQYGFISYYRKGSNTQRPSLSSTDAGELYYDTTLSKYIVWNGSAWVNMDGSAL